MKKVKKTPDEITLDATPTSLNGKLTHRVFARSGSVVLHCETFDVGKASGRSKFLKVVHERAAKKSLDINQDQMEEALLRFAAETADVLSESREFVPIVEIDPAAVLDAFCIDVLGEQEDQSIVCWSRNTRKRFVVKNPGRWNIQEIRQAVGRAGEKHLAVDSDESRDAGQYSPADLQRAVALTAADAPRMSVTKMIGQGVWMRHDKIVVVNGEKAHVLKEETFQPVSRPRFGKEIIDFNADKAWTSDRLLSDSLDMSPKKALAIYQELEEILRQWNWSHQWDARVAASLVCATFIQTCWTWRPLVMITGSSDVGKSTLLGDVLHPLFGEWTIAADRSTEAGLRQAIGHDAAPILVDEFDKYRHRQQVFELFRTASRGGKILRGTASQEGQEFGLKHLAWFAAIESGDIWGQDRNRFIKLELLPLENRGRLSIPNRATIMKLGQRAAAMALWAARAAIGIADRIKSLQVTGVHGRLVESFAVAAAVDAVVRNGLGATDAKAKRGLKEFLKNRSALEEQCEPDEVCVLRDILSSTIRVLDGLDRGSVERTIGQLLHDGATHNQDLETRGLRILNGTSPGKHKLFLANNVVRDKVLRDTRWQHTRIEQLLRRLPGAERSQQRCGGQRPSGVLLPWPDCITRIDGEDEGETP